MTIENLINQKRVNKKTITNKSELEFFLKLKISAEPLTYVRRGDVFYCQLTGLLNGEQNGIRPVVVVQNNVGNKYGPSVIVAAITGEIKSNIPTHLDLKKNKNHFLSKDSIFLAEQLATVNKKRLLSKIGHLTEDQMHQVTQRLAISLAISLVHTTITK